MSRTMTVASALIPVIEALEERVVMMVYGGGIPTDQAKDIEAQAQG